MYSSLQRSRPGSRNPQGLTPTSTCDQAMSDLIHAQNTRISPTASSSIPSPTLPATPSPAERRARPEVSCHPLPRRQSSATSGERWVPSQADRKSPNLRDLARLSRERRSGISQRICIASLPHMPVGGGGRGLQGLLQGGLGWQRRRQTIPVPAGTSSANRHKYTDWAWWARDTGRVSLGGPQPGWHLNLA